MNNVNFEAIEKAWFKPKEKYMILLKFYNTTWKPYFFGHTYDKKEAEELYKHTLNCYPNSQWALIKIVDIHKIQELKKEMR